MADDVECTDPWGLPFQVGDRVKVYDGNKGSPTKGTWLYARVFRLSAAKVGVCIEEDGWDTRYAARHFVPCTLVRHVDVLNAFAVIEFTPNAQFPTHANVVFPRASNKPNECFSIKYVTAKNDLLDARAWEKWTKFKIEKTAHDPHQLDEMSELEQGELARDLERAIRSEVARKNHGWEERTFQWRLLKLATSCLLSKYCVQPVTRLKQVVQSWKHNKSRIPLGNEAVAIADTWERFRKMKRLQLESVAQPEFTYTNEFRSTRFKSYHSIFNPDVTHAFYKSNFPPAENELKKFPVSLQEYPEKELPVAPPGPCTRDACDPEHRDHFCYKDEVRRSEPPRWRKVAMLSDQCDECGVKTADERAQRQKEKWEDRSRCALSFNEKVEFSYKFGHVTNYPIALSSFFEPTVAWRKDLQHSLHRRLTTVPASAFSDETIFQLPYAVWAAQSSPLRLELQPMLPNLILDAFEHTLEGRKFSVSSATTVKIVGHSTASEKGQSPIILMTIIPSAILPGLAEQPLVDLSSENWKKWLPLCYKEPKFVPIARILEKVIEMDNRPAVTGSSTWLHALSTIGQAIHLLRTLPILQPVPYLEDDINKFAKMDKPSLAKKGHIPEDELEKPLMKRPRSVPTDATPRVSKPKISKSPPRYIPSEKHPEVALPNTPPLPAAIPKVRPSLPMARTPPLPDVAISKVLPSLPKARTPPPPPVAKRAREREPEPARKNARDEDTAVATSPKKSTTSWGKEESKGSWDDERWKNDRWSGNWKNKWEENGWKHDRKRDKDQKTNDWYG